MPHLAQYELDDCEAALEEWLDTNEAHLGEVVLKRAALISAIDRIYEICQTAHARELRRAEVAR
jgi:hypothetical protein